MECRATIFKGDAKMHIIDKSLVELSAFRSHLSLFLGAIEKANLLGFPFFTLRTAEMMIDVTQKFLLQRSLGMTSLCFGRYTEF